ncbi:MAG: diaminopimelate epimerase [Syntrophales bacterium]|nr:diaminopimelate epimerase [Syntrophales bacterium]
MIDFFKMSGSGNDFILIDNREQIVETNIGTMPVVEFVKAVCEPKVSLGADGLILIQNSDRADFSWRFFNADGSEVEMCGNGGRCAARFALIKGITRERMVFETEAGIIDAEVKEDTVKLRLTDPFDMSIGVDILIDGRNYRVDSLNTGVPHVIYQVADVVSYDVVGMGRKTRYHEHFQPRGTNANFLQVLDRHHLKVRTYERGVEDETLACGTGSVASALIASWKELVDSPVDVEVKSGEILRIHFDKTVHGFERVYLEGKAKVVCQGSLWEEAYR